MITRLMRLVTVVASIVGMVVPIATAETLLMGVCRCRTTDAGVRLSLEPGRTGHYC